MSEPLAIYLRPRGYVVKRYDGNTAGLWALLGEWYTPERARVLADSLNQERLEEKL